jgi:hypothetical protein
MAPRLLTFSFLLFLVCAAIATRTPSSPGAVGQQDSASHVFTKDSTVWVSDFELDAQDVKTDKGGIIGEVRPGILERPKKRREQDPAEQAKKLVDLMSNSIVDDLRKAGYRSERLEKDVSRPTSGAWVHGVFTEVDEGNRRRRAIIGFGSGQTTMDLYVTLSDLRSPDKPLYDASTSENSGKHLGAVITMNPYVAAAKFVMEKNAPEKTVKKTASDISKEVVRHLKEYETAGPVN